MTAPARNPLKPLATALLVVAMGGCRTLSGDADALRVANWGGVSEDNAYERTVQSLYRRFEREQGVHLRMERIPGSQDYVRKMILSFVAGSQPDVMFLDASSAAVFIENGVLEDLRPYLARDPRVRSEDFFPNVWRIAARDEAVYAIPGDFTPMVLYYNAELFDRAGVPYPKPGWTYADFLRTAKALTKEENGRTVQHGFLFANWMPGWITWMWNRGADVLSPDGRRATGTLDSPAAVGAVTFLRDLITRHGVAPSLSQTAATGVDPFANGTAAMKVSGHWEVPFFQKRPGFDPARIGVAPLPSDLPEPVTVMYQVGLAMPKGARRPDKAWEFIRYSTSREFQRAYQATGVAICARRDVSRERAADPREQTFLRIVPSARRPWGATVVGYDFVEYEGRKMMDRVLNGEDPATALRRMAERIDAYFAVR